MNKPDLIEDVPHIGAFQAKTELSRMLREAKAGKRFVITQRGKPVAQLIPIEEDPVTVWGDMEGGIQLSDDFNEPLDDFAEYMEEKV